MTLTNEQKKSYEKAKFATVAKKRLYIGTIKIKTIAKLKTIAITQVNTDALHIAYVI